MTSYHWLFPWNTGLCSDALLCWKLSLLFHLNSFLQFPSKLLLTDIIINRDFSWIICRISKCFQLHHHHRLQLSSGANIWRNEANHQYYPRYRQTMNAWDVKVNKLGSFCHPSLVVNSCLAYHAIVFHWHQVTLPHHTKNPGILNFSCLVYIPKSVH